MTKEEMQKKGQEKIQAIENLCKQLEITLAAEQVLTERGLIKLIVYYYDTEKYDIDTASEAPKKDETPAA